MSKEAIGPVQIHIRPRLLGAIAKWAYQSDDTRPHLNVVRFGDGEIVALDGHRAVMLPCATASGVAFGISPKVCEAIIAAHAVAGVRHHDLVIDVPPEAVGMGVRKTCVTFETRDRKTFEVWAPIQSVKDYPNYKQVIPGKPETAAPPTYLLNSRYLAAIDEIEREHPDYHSGNDGVRIVSWTAIGADGIAGPPMFEGVGGTRYIVMPMRDREGAGR